MYEKKNVKKKNWIFCSGSELLTIGDTSPIDVQINEFFR